MELPIAYLQFSTILKETTNSGKKVPEGFKNQRLTILPIQVISRLSEHPISRLLYPTRIGYFPAAESHYVNRERGIPEHLLIHCTQGKGRGSFAENTFPIEAGQVALFPANIAHHYESSPEQPWSISWVHLRGELERDYFKSLQLSPSHPVMQINNPEQAREQFECLYGLTRGIYSDTTLLGLHTQLASYLTTLANGRRESVPKKRDRSERINRVIQHLNKNLHRTVEIAEMAALSNWTPNHFNTAFKQQIQETPASYFLHLKMARASEELRSTNRSIEDIAHGLGFDDAFYFSRCYKRSYGISPSDFRKAAE